MGVVTESAILGIRPELRKVLEALDDQADAKQSVLRGFVAYTDTTAKTLGYIPANAHIIDVKVFVETAFNDSGTDQLSVGKLGTTNHYVSALDVSATGQKAPTITNLADVGANGVGVVGIYAGQNSNASTGKAWVTVTYVVQAS